MSALPDDFLTAAEAAKRLRTSKRGVYDWLAQGEISHYRVGRLLRIRATDLVSYLERRRNQPPQRTSTYGRHPTR